MIKKIKRNLLILIVASVILYLALTIYANFNLVIKAFENFPLIILPFLLLLSFINYFTRFLKWHYYLNKLRVEINFGKSFHIFFSGLLMSITPGKFGELLKAYLVKYESNEPVSKIMPVTIVERMTDFYSLLILAIFGAYIYNVGKATIIITLFFFVILTIILINKKFAFRIIHLLNYFSIIRKFTSHLEQAYQSAYLLLQPVPLFSMTLLSIISWGIESLGFYFILVSFNLNVSVYWSVFIYSFATIAGSITLLPAGIGVTEGSLTYFISRISGNISTAVAATLITRAVTLWFAIFIGIVSLYLYHIKNKNFIDQLENTSRKEK